MHYEDDNYHPNNMEVDEYEFQNVGMSDDFSDSITFTSVTSKRNRVKKEDDIRNLDKGYHKIKIPYGRKHIEIELYSTSVTPGKPIRDAVTGSRMTKHRVGSLDENLYFKVGLATGQLGNDGGVLFYDSPEQCERHMRCVISPEIKQKWTDKCIAARLRKYEE